MTDLPIETTNSESEAGSSQANNLPVFVGNKREFVEKQKVKCNVNGRDIVVFHHNQRFYAMDQLCYHAGGPLDQGDIEDIGGRWCIICPYHKQKITLETGEGLHYSIDHYNLKKPPELCSKGVVQRVHQVQVIDNKLYITLSDSKEYLPSDYFYSKKVVKNN